MTKTNTNNHRGGKHPFQVWQFPEEKAKSDEAKRLTNTKTDRELLNRLVDDVLNKP